MIDLSIFQSTEFLIPFLFVFSVIFGALQIARAFSKAANFAIALALTLFAITNPGFLNLLWSQFGNLTVFFIAMFFLLFLLEAFGLRRGGREASESVVIYGAILFILLSIGYLFTDMLPTLPVIGGGQNLLLLILILVVVSLFWAAFKTKEMIVVRK
jgi:hypothetical protein